MKVTRIGDWQLARRIVATAQARLRQATQKAVLQEAHFFRAKVVEGLREQAPGGQPLQPPAPTTLAVRRLLGFRGTKALIVRGDLRNAIAVIVERGGVSVGVLRTARAQDGTSLVNIAELNEFGSQPIVRRLTGKAQRFLHAAFRAAGLALPGGARRSSGILIVRIPPRPFLRPVFERYGGLAVVSRRFLSRLSRLLGGNFG